MSTAAVPSSRPKNNNRDKGRSHLTNRTAYGNANNSHRKDGPDNEMPSTMSTTPVTGVYKDPRTSIMLCSVLGARTSVKTRNRKYYHGFTTGFSAEGDIALADAKLDNEDNLQDSNLPGIVIPRDTLVMAKAAGVDFKGLSVGANDFTDAGITSRLNGSAENQLKELQPWDDGGADTATALLLDENSKGWEPSEMFQVNSVKFNIQSSYSEDLDGYTTPKVAPSTEGYEERAKFAARQAEEIERSDAYKARIAKECSDTSEEAKYASVLEGGPNSGHSGGGKNAYTIPALRDGDHNMRNNNPAGRGQGRTMQRQNSPYSSSTANHSQSHTSAHQSAHNSRHPMNNHFHQGPPPGRSQVPPHQRQQQQSPSPSHGPPIPHHHPSAPHSMQQQQHPQTSQQQQRPSSAHQQLVTSTSKGHSNVPVNVPMQPVSKGSHPQQNLVSASKGAVSLNAPQQIPVLTPRLPGGQQHINGEAKPGHMEINALSQKASKFDVSSRTDHKANPSPPSSSQISASPRVTESIGVPTATVADSTVQSVSSASAAVVTSSQSVSQDRRPGRNIENNAGENRTKVNKQLQDFSKNFVLENSASTTDSLRSEAAEVTEDSSTSSSTLTSSSVLPLSPASPSATTESASSSSEQSAAPSSKVSEKSDDSSSSSTSGGIISKLNPLAKEFTPAVSVVTMDAKRNKPAVDAQSPSPQQRVSPQVTHQMMPYASSPFYGMAGIPPGMTAASLPAAGMVPFPPQNKRGTVGRMNELAAHQAHHVTGQPLLATSPHIVYMSTNQSGGYQVVNMGNPGCRMVPPNSFTMPQAGQPGPMDPTNPQAQPQPVFPGQQQAIPTPMPAHLSQHPQPAHAQALQNPSTNPTAQPAHVPNPAPSPVQHQPQQQTAQQYGGQPLPHHMSQGPPQSANPQASPYPPMSLHHGLPNMPRTSMAGQHGMAQSGHPTVSISYPLSTPHSYHNASPAQFTHAAQPQTSQNNNLNTGHQPHYVIMPPPQQPMQQQHHGQAYTATGIQFQSGHNIVQGSSQMPPSHTTNPTQGAPHLIHPGMQAMQAGIHQQVPGAASGLFMQVQSPHPQFQHQQ